MTTLPFSYDPQSDFGGDIDHVPAAAILRAAGAGDLVVDGSGDFVAVGGPAAVIRDRIKELLCPYGAFGRYVRDHEGLKWVDGDYGNPAYLLLSEPMNTLPLQLIADLCEYVMEKDSRIKSATAVPDIVPDTGLLLIRIDYVLVDGFAGTLSLRLIPPEGI